jgi:anaerobic ribonucleoside-triphosphate reductase activating protein
LKIQLNRAHHPITVLGYGSRIGLWLQGCSVGCHGCMSLDTWAPDGSREIEVADLVGWCEDVTREDPSRRIDGVTISGGEPFDQPEALLELVRELRRWADTDERDLLCYSGRALTVLRARHQPVLDLLDAVVTGPYVAAAAPGGPLRGSANQDLVLLTERGRERYGAAALGRWEGARMQVILDGDTAYYVGVPGPGDLTRLTAALARRGIDHRSVSWRT